MPLCGLQGLACVEEVHHGGVEDNCASNANAASQRSGRASDGGDAEGFVLCSVALGDKPSGRREVLEVHGQSAPDNLPSYGAENPVPWHGRRLEDNVDSR